MSRELVYHDVLAFLPANRSATAIHLYMCTTCITAYRRSLRGVHVLHGFVVFAAHAKHRLRVVLAMSRPL